MNPRDIMSLCQKSVFILLSQVSGGCFGTTINSLSPLLVDDTNFKIIIVMKKGFSDRLNSENCREFSISLLSERQVQVAQKFAVADRTALAAHTYVQFDPDLKIQVISESVFALKCHIFNSLTFETNELLICNVDDFKEYDSKTKPLTYLKRQYQ